MSAARPVRADAPVLENAGEPGAGYRLRLAVDGWPGSEPGQFLMLSPGARGSVVRDDPLLPRPMAVYRSVADGNGGAAVDVLYKVVGRGTGLLSEVTPGECVRVVGPLGRGFRLPPEGEPAVLVGGGTGIASLYELAVRAAQRGPVRVLLGARRADELMGRADFEALSGVDIALATEDGSAGVRGLVTALLDPLGPDERVYVCGPTPMMRAVAQRAEAAGAACCVSLENPMACGFGVCLGCAAPRSDGGIALVCRDGPVFDAAEIAWESLA